MKRDGMIQTGDNQVKTCPITILSPTNSIRTRLGMKALYSARPTTKLMRPKTALYRL